MEGSRPSSVEDFLQHLGLSHRNNLLQDQGYENLGDFFLLSKEDLSSFMDEGEIVTILSAVDNIDINLWLTYHELERYDHLFRNHEIRTVGELKKLKITDDLMDELEVMVPGHRKRLSSAASHMCLSDDTPSTSSNESQTYGPGEPVAFGYWDKKDAIPTIKSDLLWVNGVIKSNISGHDDAELEFMVDTGSEVVTCKEELVRELALEFLQNIGSKGIHAIARKPLYRGILILGNKELEVEIMPDDYNSVGCNVVRQFSHFINDSRHVWFS